MTELDELKQILEILPSLKNDMHASELAYLRQSNSNSGYQENGFVYNITPTVYNNYTLSKTEYNKYNLRRWELINKLGLNCSVDGMPDFGESNIKPYGFDRDDVKLMRDYNSPISLIK